MTRRCLTILIGSLILSASAAALAAPQDAGRNTGIFEEPRFEDPRFIDLSFRGGTATEYIAALQKASAAVNIVVLNDISRVKMPPIVLKRVAIESAVGLLEDVPDNDISPTMILSVEHLAGPGEQSNDVFTVRALSRGQRSGSPLRTSVVSVRELLDGPLKADDLLTAVETALNQLQDDYSAADVKFHEATGLLICRGHAEQTNAIEQVISQLERDYSKRMRLERHEQDVEQLTARLHEVEQEMNELRELLSAAERRAHDLESLVQAKEHQIRIQQEENMQLRTLINRLEHENPRQTGGGR